MAHRHDFPKDRIVSSGSQENGSLSSDFFTRTPREYHQFAEDELQAAAEFANDPHARSHAHHRNIRITSACDIARAGRVGKDEARSSLT